MQDSTRKMLALLLSLAMLLSFPVCINASTGSYEETFTGTYEKPVEARNVLVSGSDAKISQWYGDRVVMGGTTYTVRQNEYGLNKDGNAIEAELGETYTLWLAQYGVATLVFTAPSAGSYCFYTSEAPYDHSPSYMYVKTYTKETVEDKDVYNQRSWEYGTFKRQYNQEYGEHLPKYDQMAYTVVELEEGETLYIAASADHEKDYVYNLTAKEWTAEKCEHKYRRCGVTNYDKEACEADRIVKCEFCGDEKYVHKSKHSYKRVVTLIDAKTCKSRIDNKCEYCGKISDSWTRYHYNVKWDYDEKTGIETAICLDCGKIINRYPGEIKDAGSISENQKKLVNIEIVNDSYKYTFVPTVTATYYFYSTEYAEDDYIDTEGYIEIVDEKGNIVEYGYNDDDKYDYNFKIKSKLEAGKTYYLRARFLSSNKTGKFYVTVSRTNPHVWEDPDECSHTYEWVRTDKSNVNDTKCIKYVDYQKCKYCDDEIKDEWIDHRGRRELVQDTHQIGAKNQCGSIHYECAECGEDRSGIEKVHSYHIVKSGADIVLTCVRCGDEIRYKGEPSYNPGGGSGGAGGGGGGALPEEEPVEEPKPEVKPVVKPVVEEKAPTATSTKVDGVWVDTALAKTSVTSKSIKKTSFTVTFKEAKKADGYQVEYSTSKKFTKKTSKKATVKKASKKATKKTVKNVKNNKKYYVRVRSYKVVNGQKVYSKWSKVTTVKTKK